MVIEQGPSLCPAMHSDPYTDAACLLLETAANSSVMPAASGLIITSDMSHSHQGEYTEHHIYPKMQQEPQN